MAVEDAVIERIRKLLDESPTLTTGNRYNQVQSEEHRQSCAGWLTSAMNALCMICPDPTSAYRISADKIVGGGVLRMAHTQVGEFAAVLSRLLVDAEAGLLTSLADQARAEIFDDFLDHGQAYWKEGRKNESGVIVGVVFEDCVRRVCRKRHVAEKSVSLDQLISTLTASSVLTPTKAKRARVAAHVRTKATHAQWDEFDLHDVKASIDFTRELIASELEA